MPSKQVRYTLMTLKALFQIIKDHGSEAQTIEKKKRKGKISKKIDISENKSSDQRINNDGLANAEKYSTVDDIWGIKIISTENDTNLGLFK